MIKIALCDDEQHIVGKLSDTINAILKEQGVMSEISVFTDAGSLLQGCANSPGSLFDLLILDIEMPGMNGLDLAAKIRKMDTRVLIIFLTAHESYVYSSFEHSPFRYIPKSAFDSYMPKALRDACKVLDKERMEVGYYHAVTPGSDTKLPYHTICYIEKQGRLCVFHLADGESLSVKKSIREVYAELDGSLFVTVHSGCIVNLKYVRQIQKPVVSLENGATFVVSRANQRKVREVIHQYWGDTI